MLGLVECAASVHFIKLCHAGTSKKKKKSNVILAVLLNTE